MKILIYLLLAAVGFYFGRFVGALGLPLLYFFYSVSRVNQGRQPHRQSQQTKRSSSGNTAGTTDVLSWAYQELGVSKNADMASIEQARKRLLNHYHPDKLGQATEAEKRAAGRKVTQINQAYKIIKKVRDS